MSNSYYNPNDHDRDHDRDRDDYDRSPQHHHNNRDSSPGSPSHPNALQKFVRNIDMGEDIDFVVGVTAAALTADQLIKLAKTKKHTVSHVAKAGIGAAATLGAFALMKREHEEKKAKRQQQQSHSYSQSRGGGNRDREQSDSEEDWDDRDDRDRGHSKEGRGSFTGDREPYEERYRHGSRSSSGGSHGHHTHSHSPPERWAVVEKRKEKWVDEQRVPREEMPNPVSTNVEDQEEGVKEDVQVPTRRHSVETYERRARSWSRSPSPSPPRRRRRHSESQGPFSRFMHALAS